MIKIIAATAVLSLVVCSATGASAVPTVSGLTSPAASGIIQVNGRGRGHARAGASGRGHGMRSAFRGGRRGYRGGYGGGYGDYGGYGYGGGFCTWVGPFQVCP
jgi:hypothetical protein